MKSKVARLDWERMKEAYEEQVRNISVNVDFGSFMTGYAAGYIDGVQQEDFENDFDDLIE